MYNVFFAADHHFGHNNIYTQFKLADGVTPARCFANAAEGDEVMVERHNSVVKPADRVYFVGDVAMSHRALPILSRMNGRKVLIKGNHDIHKLSHYLPYFDDIRGSHQLDGILVTHIPVHPDSLARWGFNVHGHLHANKVMTDVNRSDPYAFINKVPDPRYFCVSVEQINYTPISLEEIKKHDPRRKAKARV